MAKARREAAEEEPRANVEDNLEGVNGVRPEGRPVTLRRPGLADQAPALVKRSLHPNQRVVGWRAGLEQLHASPPKQRNRSASSTLPAHCLGKRLPTSRKD